LAFNLKIIQFYYWFKQIPRPLGYSDMRKKQENTFNKLVFGKRLKALREQTGLSQEEMGKLINRTRVSYVIIEGGKTAPSLDCVMDIIRVLEKKKVFVSLDYLVGRSDYQNDGGVIKTIKEKLEKCETELANCQRISKLQDRLLEKS
jgi:DNA-binding XRE family transcriptional regulator